MQGSVAIASASTGGTLSPHQTLSSKPSSDPQGLMSSKPSAKPSSEAFTQHSAKPSPEACDGFTQHTALTGPAGTPFTAGPPHVFVPSRCLTHPRPPQAYDKEDAGSPGSGPSRLHSPEPAQARMGRLSTLA